MKKSNVFQVQLWVGSRCDAERKAKSGSELVTIVPVLVCFLQLVQSN